MNKVLVAIGGGHLSNQDTLVIDRKILSLSGKSNPRVMFLPTASKDDQGYAKRFKKYYRSLGCEVDALRLLHTKKTREVIIQEMFAYDIIYIGGGDTRFLMDKFKELNLLNVFFELHQLGIIIVGLSAGANILFEYGYSDVSDGFTFVKGLGLMHGAFTPHYQDRPSFDADASQYSMNKIACKDAQAYILEDEKTYFYE